MRSQQLASGSWMEHKCGIATLVSSPSDTVCQCQNFIGNLVKNFVYLGKLVNFFVHDLMSYSCA
jgi:hypothetical protein